MAYFKEDFYKKHKGIFKSIVELVKQYKKIPATEKRSRSLLFNIINHSLRELSSSYYEQFLVGYYYSVELDQACLEYFGKHFPQLTKKQRDSANLVYTEEHINDIESIINNGLVKIKRISAKKVYEFLNKNLEIAFIFKEEDNRLNKEKRNGRLTDKTNGFYYYNKVGIELLYMIW